MRMTDFVLRHRVWVLLFWVAVAVVGGATASTTSDRLSYDFALPGQRAYETNLQIATDFGGGGINDPLLLVVQGAGAEDVSRELREALEHSGPQARMVTSEDTGTLSPQADLAVLVVYPEATPGPDPYVSARPGLKRLTDEFSADGVTVTLTGFPVLVEGGGGDRGVLVEVLLGGVGALVVLALVFGSLLAGLPLVVAAVSILGTFLALLGLTEITDVSFVVQFLVALIGLGVAIDYSLLVVTRWREEVSRGLDNDDAVRAAMRTAGRSVVFSGVTVAVSLAGLVLVPVPFLRSIGLGGLLIPLLSVATSVTLVPALLSSVGPRLTWPRRKPAVTRSRRWASIAAAVLRHRWLTIAGCTVLLLGLAAPVLGLALGTAQLSGLASTTQESGAATAAVAAGLPDGTLRPTEVLVPADDVTVAAGVLGELPGVATAVAPTGPGWSVDGRALVQVWAADDPATDDGRATLTRVRDIADDRGWGVGGSPAEDVDFVSAVYGDAPWVGLGVALVTFLLLARALRSLWLPVKALVLNVVSLAAAYGVTVLIWQHGLGSDLLFGQSASGVVTIWVPVAAFSFLFGLSMDYEVFILSRMREEYDEHADTDRAVVEGIARTGRLVTSAALILFLAFVALSTVPGVDVKILATTLALGIVIDAVVVRGLLAPALVGVLGEANWTMPDPLRRLLRAS